MHIANVTVKTKWEKLEELISAKLGETFTFDADTTYFISSTGPNVVLCATVTSKPNDGEVVGLGLQNGDEAGYIKGTGDLYVSTQVGEGNIHIEEKE